MFRLFDPNRTIKLPVARPTQQPALVPATSLEVSGSPALQWGLPIMNLLLERWFLCVYPYLNVECCLVKSLHPNAFVSGRSDKGRLFVTTAAIEKIHDAGQKIHHAPFFQSTSDSGLAPASKAIDEEMTAMAFAALLGHELGHLHDQQFYPQKITFYEPTRIETQALEFAADTWGLRACTDLMLANLKSFHLSDRGKEDFILCGVTRTLIGDSVLAPLNWEKQWVTSETEWPHDHPPGARRLFSGAVAIMEWLQERQTLQDTKATGICLAAFDTAARALNWYATCQVQETGYFIKKALELHDGGASIDLWREAYERFQKNLQPRKK